MLDSKKVHQDFWSIADTFTSLARSRREFSVLLAVRNQAKAAPTRAQEDAAMEAQDVLSQADEALVM